MSAFQNPHDNTYADMLRTAMDGRRRENRTGTDTFATFGGEWRFDLSDGFPLLTTKKMFWNSIVVELLWFIQGRSDLRYLLENGVHIWSANAHDKYVKETGDSISVKEYEQRVLEDDDFSERFGDLNRVYGTQWRHWRHTEVLSSGGVGHTSHYEIDQLQNAVDLLRTNPGSRRIIVSAWNPGEIDGMALPPCHCFYQMNSRPMTRQERETAYLNSLPPGVILDTMPTPEQLDKRGFMSRALDLKLHQRSADVFLGVPFNIASYALLTKVLAQITNHAPGEFIHSFGDLHVYENHLDQAQLQLQRSSFPAPTVEINPTLRELDDFSSPDAFMLVGYEHHPAIKAKMAV